MKGDEGKDSQDEVSQDTSGGRTGTAVGGLVQKRREEKKKKNRQTVSHDRASPSQRRMVL